MWVEGTFLRPLRCVREVRVYLCGLMRAVDFGFGVSLSASREPRFNRIQIRSFFIHFHFPTRPADPGRARARPGRPGPTSRTCVGCRYGVHRAPPCGARRRRGLFSHGQAAGVLQ